jgi:hypothetical protein
MGDREYPVLGTGDVLKAYPDIKVGPVLKAFPDIKVGQVLKVDGESLDLDDISRGDHFCVLLLAAEGSGGLRIARAYGDSANAESLAELMSEIDDAAGTLDLSVLEVEQSVLTCKVVRLRPSDGDPQE